MNKEFKTWVSKREQAYIDSSSVADIIKSESESLIGGSRRYIDKDGKIREEDYRFNSDEYIRDATRPEIKTYEALKIAERYFRESR